MTALVDRIMNASTTTTTKSTLIIMSLASSTLFLGVLLRRHNDIRKKEIEKLENLREAERKGRIKAEILLRTTIKSQEEKRIAASSAFYSSASDQSKENSRENNDMLLKCIGTVVSPFVKRMGTPRQGALVPHGRGYIQLDHSMAPMETLSGIELYSHAWVIFCFHANTDCQSLSVKTKVRPPRAGGLKVGCMATRSPHRPNPIGLSLVKVLGIDKKNKRLHIAALDLVNGTPVFDVKPCVPWDIPGHYDAQPLVVPGWVSQEDSLSEVSFTEDAEISLKKLVREKILDPIYAENDGGLVDAKMAITEILSQDPRAAKRRGKVDNAKINDPYKISFGSVQVEFLVEDTGVVKVVKVSKTILEGCMYVDGIPLYKDI